MTEQLQEDKYAWPLLNEEKLVLYVVPRDNEHNKYAVAVMHNGCIVRHITQPISQVLWLFFVIVATLHSA